MKALVIFWLLLSGVALVAIAGVMVDDWRYYRRLDSRPVRLEPTTVRIGHPLYDQEMEDA